MVCGCTETRTTSGSTVSKENDEIQTKIEIFKEKYKKEKEKKKENSTFGPGMKKFTQLDIELKYWLL